MRLFSAHHVDRTWPQLSGLVAVAALLYAAGGVGMAYVAGFGAVHRRLANAQWWWLVPSLGAVVLAFCGYYFGYRAVKRVEGRPELDQPALLAVVAAGFGGFLAHGGTALMNSRCFEHEMLAMIVCPAAIVALGTGMIFTRRTAPLGGAGLMIVALVPTLWYGAAVPFATATLGVAAYRFLTLWVPIPVSLAAIPKLRNLGSTGQGGTGGGTRTSKGEPALEH